MKPCCGNCGSWHERTDINTTDGIPGGECRNSAPVVHGDDEPAWGVWPLTKENEGCTEDWQQRPTKRKGRPLSICTVCGRQKRPVGRDAPAGAGPYCDHDCAGYMREPLPDNLWPDEKSEPE